MIACDRSLGRIVLLTLPILIATGGGARAEEPEAVQLKFDWKPGLEAQVETSRGRTLEHYLPDAKPSEVTIQYTLKTKARKKDLHVTFENLKPLNENLPEPNDLLNTIVQFGGLVPDIHVSTKGEFLRVHDAEQAAVRMGEVSKILLSDIEETPALGQVMSVIRSEGYLESIAAKQWQDLVEIWLGQEIEIGELYGGEGVAPHPFLPGTTIDMTVTFYIDERVPCSPSDKGQSCVSVHKTTEYDLDDMKDVGKKLGEQLADEAEKKAMEKLEVTVAQEEMHLITEPGTLLPHRFEHKKIFELRFGPTDADRDGRIEFQKSTFRYPKLPSQ